jgi:hypothetical protein
MLLVLAAAGWGCQGAKDEFRGLAAADLARQSEGQRPPERPDRPAAIVNGQTLAWDELQPLLAEAAGGTVLQEVVLDRLLEPELRLRGLKVGPEAIARERELLLEAIVREARATPDDAERLLASVRRSRGLGDVRFARLLARNAELRALAGALDPPVVEPEAIEREYLIRHGPRYSARVLVAATPREAGEIRARLLANPPVVGGTLAAQFAEEAARHSIDPSAERGGIVDPISPADPSYPASIRAALERLAPGELSAVLAVDRGYALLLLEEQLAGDGLELAEVSTAIAEDLLRREERLAMDDVARRLLREANIAVMDRGLDWSWRGTAPER